MIKFFFITTAVTGLLFSVCLNAKLLHFNKTEEKESYLFEYQWTDQSGNTDTMAFSLPKTSLFDLFRDFKAYKSDIAQKYVQHKIKKHLIKEPIDGVLLKYSHQHKNHSFIITGRNPEAIDKAQDKIKMLEKKYLQEYLDTHYYHFFETHDRIQAIKPNHLKFAEESVIPLKSLKPLILDKVSVQNIRQVTDFTLGFVQNIPYSTLESRTLSSGVGFNPPLKVLWENQGDCDSKATLTIAILRSLMPRVKLALIFLKEHALVAIHIPPVGDDLSINIKDETYVLADPTGPQLMTLGEVSTDTKVAILQGQYVAEVYE